MKINTFGLTEALIFNYCNMIALSYSLGQVFASQHVTVLTTQSRR